MLKGLEGLEELARGLEALTQLWLRALVICCGGAREEDIEIRGDFVQASPPPYFVRALPSFFFTAHQRPSHRILWPLTQWSLLGMRRCEERTQTLDLLVYIFIYLAYIIERTWTYITIHTLFLSLYFLLYLLRYNGHNFIHSYMCLRLMQLISSRVQVCTTSLISYREPIRYMIKYIYIYNQWAVTTLNGSDPPFSSPPKIACRTAPK